MITLNDAQNIIHATLEYARGADLPPMTVAVLNAGGHLLAFAREDDSSLLREKIARGKAMGALNMGVDTRVLAARAETHPHFFASLMALAEGEVVPVAGGVLVRNAAGEVVGAVGVSGAVPDADEKCAITGIHSAGLAVSAGLSPL